MTDTATLCLNYSRRAVCYGYIVNIDTLFSVYSCSLSSETKLVPFVCHYNNAHNKP